MKSVFLLRWILLIIIAGQFDAVHFRSETYKLNRLRIRTFYFELANYSSVCHRIVGMILWIVGEVVQVGVVSHV